MADWFSQDFTYFDAVKAFVPPLAGALAGALAAQGIAARNKRYDDQVKELGFIGMTAALAYGVTEAFIGVKKSNVKPMFDNWDADRRRREETVRNAARGATPMFEFDADFRTLTPVKAGVDQLRALMYGNIRLDTRAIALMGALDRCVDQHANIIAENNRLVAKFEADNLTAEPLAARLFGLRVGTRVDDRYPTTIRALYSGTDDCIMFSRLLGNELVEHGKRLAPKVPKERRGRYVVTDFSRAERDGLMPNPEEYKDWLPLPHVAAPPPSLWQRIKGTLYTLSE
jgi:hypothetical protein